MRNTILDMLQFAANTEFSGAESVAPLEQVASCACGFDAEVLELGGGEREEG